MLAGMNTRTIEAQIEEVKRRREVLGMDPLPEGVIELVYNDAKLRRAFGLNPMVSVMEHLFQVNPQPLPTEQTEKQQTFSPGGEGQKGGVYP